MAAARLSEAERDAVRDRYQSDPALTVEGLADEYGVGKATMLRYLQGVTRPIGRKPQATMTVDDMIRLRYEEGLTYREIGKQAGIEESSVAHRIRRHLNGRQR